MEAKEVMQKATGYYELGLLHEADMLLAEEVSEPTVEIQHLRILIKVDRAEWSAAEELSREAIERFPERAFGYIQCAYALHEMKRTEEAAALLETVPKDPIDHLEDVICYNRACYNATLGKREKALDELREALAHNTKLIKDALKDPDFESIRADLEDLY